MRSWKTFLYLFTGESELFMAAILLITFGTVTATSQSINQLLGTYVYFSRIVLTIFISMAIGGVAIQLSTVKRLTDEYVGYVFSTISVVSNSTALVLELFEMVSHGANWLGMEFFGDQQIPSNSLLLTLGFIIFGFSVVVTIFSVLDLMYISFGEKR